MRDTRGVTRGREGKIERSVRGEEKGVYAIYQEGTCKKGRTQKGRKVERKGEPRAVPRHSSAGSAKRDGRIGRGPQQESTRRVRSERNLGVRDGERREERGDGSRNPSW